MRIILGIRGARYLFLYKTGCTRQIITGSVSDQSINKALECKTIFIIAQVMGRLYIETISTYLDLQNIGSPVYFKKLLMWILFLFTKLKCPKNIHEKIKNIGYTETNLKIAVHKSGNSLIQLPGRQQMSLFALDTDQKPHNVVSQPQAIVSLDMLKPCFYFRAL